jgi:hypothetical protein
MSEKLTLKERFLRKGLNVSQWAKKYNHNYETARKILTGIIPIGAKGTAPYRVGQSLTKYLGDNDIKVTFPDD